MGINAVMGYVKSVLDGLEIPGEVGPLACFIVPPDPDVNENGTPRASVWSADGDVSRLSGPRQLPDEPGTAGWKDQWHNLAIFLWYPMSDEEPDEDSAFPGVVDAVMYALATVPNPAIITDPLTGVQTQLVGLGESMTWLMPPPMALAAQRWEKWACQITGRTLEQIRG
jgi:hypothetical protein